MHREQLHTSMKFITSRCQRNKTKSNLRECTGSGFGAGTPFRHRLNSTFRLWQQSNPGPRTAQSLFLSHGNVKSGTPVSFPGHTSCSRAETNRDLGVVATGFVVRFTPLTCISVCT